MGDLGEVPGDIASVGVHEGDLEGGGSHQADCRQEKEEDERSLSTQVLRPSPSSSRFLSGATIQRSRL